MENKTKSKIKLTGGSQASTGGNNQNIKQGKTNKTTINLFLIIWSWHKQPSNNPKQQQRTKTTINLQFIMQ